MGAEVIPYGQCLNSHFLKGLTHSAVLAQAVRDSQKAGSRIAGRAGEPGKGNVRQGPRGELNIYSKHLKGRPKKRACVYYFFNPLPRALEGPRKVLESSTGCVGVNNITGENYREPINCKS